MIEVKQCNDEFIVTEIRTGGNWSTAVNGVQVVHIPSGLYAECAIYRSQHKNKRDAIEAIQNELTQK